MQFGLQFCTILIVPNIYFIDNLNSQSMRNSINGAHTYGFKVDSNQNGITFDVIVEPVMLIKFAPASVASALARRVFPVPGGPKSNIPLQG